MRALRMNENIDFSESKLVAAAACDRSQACYMFSTLNLFAVYRNGLQVLVKSFRVTYDVSNMLTSLPKILWKASQVHEHADVTAHTVKYIDNTSFSQHEMMRLSGFKFTPATINMAQSESNLRSLIYWVCNYSRNTDSLTLNHWNEFGDWLSSPGIWNASKLQPAKSWSSWSDRD